MINKRWLKKLQKITYFKPRVNVTIKIRKSQWETIGNRKVNIQENHAVNVNLFYM